MERFLSVLSRSHNHASKKTAAHCHDSRIIPFGEDPRPGFPFSYADFWTRISDEVDRKALVAHVYNRAFCNLSPLQSSAIFGHENTPYLRPAYTSSPGHSASHIEILKVSRILVSLRIEFFA